MIDIIILLFVDIDECRDNIDNCSQICLNTIGSYTCDCNLGYRIATDERACDGIISYNTIDLIRHNNLFDQISMNAMNGPMHAFIIVRTLLAHTYALVVLATAWPVIDTLAMVINMIGFYFKKFI